MTPRRFAAVLKRWRLACIRDQFTGAQLTYIVANYLRDRKQHPDAYQFREFFITRPTARETGEDAPRPRQGWQQQLRMVEALNAAYGGKDLRRRAS